MDSVIRYVKMNKANIIGEILALLLGIAALIAALIPTGAAHLARIL